MIAIWQMYRSLWTPEACSEVIELGKKLQLTEATVGHEEGVALTDDWRRSRVGWAYPNTDGWEGVFKELSQCFIETNLNCFGFDVSHLKEIQFTEYDAEYEGHYDWHIDTGWMDPRPSQRKLSMVVQLSDPTEYEGGDFEMKPPMHSSPLPEQLRERGTILLFPSFVQHRVAPVSKGTRYSLVAWMEGPQFR